jgi:hypothetical protein
METNQETATRPPCGEWLAAFIEEAFHDVAYPGDDRLWDDMDSDPYVRKNWNGWLVGQDWRTLQKRFEESASRGIYPCRDMWMYLTPEAAAYYVPGALTLAAREIDFELAQSFLFMLDIRAYSAGAQVNWVRRFASVLSGAQRRAIALMMRCMQGDRDDVYFGAFQRAWNDWAALAGLDARTALPEN